MQNAISHIQLDTLLTTHTSMPSIFKGSSLIPKNFWRASNPGLMAELGKKQGERSPKRTENLSPFWLVATTTTIVDCNPNCTNRAQNYCPYADVPHHRIFIIVFRISSGIHNHPIRGWGPPWGRDDGRGGRGVGWPSPRRRGGGGLGWLGGSGSWRLLRAIKHFAYPFFSHDFTTV